MKEETKGLNLSIRRAEAVDEPFLEAVYADSRRDEIAMLGWGKEQENAFFTMQFRMQTQAYKWQFPDADYYVVEQNQKPIGRLIVNRAEDEVRLIDVALLSEFRGTGSGTFLLRELQAEAAAVNKPLTLQVLKTNRRAALFYERCGFVVTGASDLYLAMQWRNI